LRKPVPCDHAVGRRTHSGRIASRVLAAPAFAAAFALVLALLATVATVRPIEWNITGLATVGMSSPLARDAREIDPDFRLVGRPGYDGQFYWAIAVDPLATNRVHRGVDNASYRYGHPLLGWVGWLLSGGQAGAVADALLAVGLISFAAAAALAAQLAEALRRARWAPLFVCCNVGLLFSSIHDLVEPLAAALLLGTLWAAERRPRLAVGLCVLLPLAKEQLVLVPIVLAAWEVRRNRRLAAAYLGAIVPSFAWWVAMRIHLGAWFTSGGGALGTPFSGWRRAILDAGAGAATNDHGDPKLFILVALGGLLAVATLRALKSRSRIDGVFLALILVALCLAPPATVILRDALRNTALLVALVPFVMATRRSPSSDKPATQ
jgi:hypothetical protein